jgi:phospholipid/cholesterol/gamma-HCH transport system substrate-binding protein
MNTKFNYTIIGLFIVTLTVGLIAIFIWLSAFWERKSYITYATYINEAVSGLNVQNAVKFNGVPVGYVSDISLNPQNPQQVLILMKIEKGIPITTSTVATLNTIGVTGVDYIELKAKDNRGIPLQRKTGEKYPIIKSQASVLEQLGTTLHEVTVTMRELSQSVQKVLNTQNQKALQNSFKNISTFTQTLADNSQEIDDILKSTQVLAQNMKTASQNFPQLTAAFQKTLNSANAAANQLNQASQRISSTMQDSRLMVQNISQQILPSAFESLNSIEALASNLQQLSVELKQNPSILVRGKAPGLTGPGEN